jgi:hypothetical protein
MAISIDWSDRIIYVPKADLTLIQSLPVEVREMNLNWFRLQLKDLEDSVEGMPFLDTHKHNTEVDVGGLVLARVVEIINDYTITFEDGQYAVNLVGANSNVGDRVNVNQVSVRTSNSAGLISSPAIEYASYNGGVTVDTNSPYSGTVFPIGTPQQPVNNLTDAMLIADYRGFGIMYVLGDLEVDNGGDYSNMTFMGESISRTILTIVDDANVAGSEFYECTVQGVLDGNAKCKNCRIMDINYIYGVIESCLLGPGIITLGGANEAHFLDCWSGVIGEPFPIIDCGGAGQSLAVRNYNGCLEIKNMTGLSDMASVDLNSGLIRLHETCTDGYISIRGIGDIIDNSQGSNIDISDLVNSQLIADKVWDENLYDHTSGSSAGAILLGIDPDALADNILNGIVEGTYTLKQIVRLMASVLTGKTTGGGSNVLRFRDLLDSKDRIVSTVDSNSNRISVVLDSE